jgi:2-polyprenyl-6-methoxyphenol hydroxylase-like FAD-dependent oxidoreductase
MARIVIAGGGVAGLATAWAAAGHGHDVVVVDGSPPPPDGPAARAATGWRRAAVPQAQHTHTLTSAGVRVLRTRAPQVLETLLDAGAHLLELTRSAPHPGVPDDPDLVALGCRRTFLELVLHRAVARLPEVEFRYGEPVRGVTVDSGRRVRAAVAGGAELPADLVVDATGRRACGRAWLAAAGFGVRADRVVPTRQVVLGRFYRKPGPHGPLNRGNAAGVVGDHYVGVLHPGDGDHFSVAVGLPVRDPDLAVIREPAVFDAVMAATPWVRNWLADGAVAVSGVHVLGSPPNVLGGPALDPAPPVTGLVPVGDAACVTDPIFGRGMSLALVHGTELADLVDGVPDAGFAARAAGLAAGLFRPWYEHAAETSTGRLRRLREAESGATGTAAPPSGLQVLGLAAARDAVVWHRLTRMLMGLDRPGLLDEPDFHARVRAALTGPAGAVPVGPPSRAELLDVVARARRSVPC